MEQLKPRMYTMNKRRQDNEKRVLSERNSVPGFSRATKHLRVLSA